VGSGISPPMRWSKPARARPAYFEPCLRTASKVVPQGPMWVHEIKLDGYRLIVRRSMQRRLKLIHAVEWHIASPAHGADIRLWAGSEIIITDGPQRVRFVCRVEIDFR
jgi:hypothetical protein